MTNKLTISQESFLVDPKTRAIASLLLGVAILATVPILVRLSENEISPNAVIFHRLWIAAIMLGLIKGLPIISNKLFNIDNNIDNQIAPVESYIRGKVGLLLATGIFFVGSQIGWAWSLVQTSIANSALLHNFTPVFVTVAGFLLFNQRFDSRFIIGIIVGISGSVILGLDDILYGTSKIQGDVIAFISTFFLAIYLLLVERIRNQLDTITTLLCCSLIGTFATLPILLTNTDRIFPSSWLGWLALMGLGLSVVLGHGLIVYSLKCLPSELVAVTMLLDPVFTAILAWAIFSETLDLYNLLAFITILVGTYLATTSPSAIKEK
ncbi:MAG TPA: DMT family transporter [Kamptonema sp.]|nr:DMT family transporter [Kamptonema sp.]